MTTSPLNDFLGFLDDDRLEIPHIPNREHDRASGGQSYWVESPDAETGQRLAAFGEILFKQANGLDVSETDVKRLVMNDDEEVEFGHRVLGDVYEQMAADGVTHEHRKRAVNYAFMAFAFSEEQAREMAEKGGLSGKPVPPANRAARRAPAKKTPTRSTTSPRTPRKR